MTGDGKRYFDTFVRKRRDELLKQRETDRKTVGGGLVNFQDAEKRAGYIGSRDGRCIYPQAIPRHASDWWRFPSSHLAFSE